MQSLMLGSMAHRSSAVTVSLYVALGSFTLGCAGHIELPTYLEIGNGDLLPYLVRFSVAHGKLREMLFENTALRKVSSERLVHPLFESIFISDLNRIVSIDFDCLNLSHNLGPRLDDSYRNDLSCICENLSHSDFLSQNHFHIVFLRVLTVDRPAVIPNVLLRGESLILSFTA